MARLPTREKDIAALANDIQVAYPARILPTNSPAVFGLSSGFFAKPASTASSTC